MYICAYGQIMQVSFCIGSGFLFLFVWAGGPWTGIIRKNRGKTDAKTHLHNLSYVGACVKNTNPPSYGSNFREKSDREKRSNSGEQGYFWCFPKHKKRVPVLGLPSFINDVTGVFPQKCKYGFMFLLFSLQVEWKLFFYNSHSSKRSSSS